MIGYKHAISNAWPRDPIDSAAAYVVVIVEQIVRSGLLHSILRSCLRELHIAQRVRGAVLGALASVELSSSRVVRG